MALTAKWYDKIATQLNCNNASPAIIEGLAGIFGEDNPRFDIAKFYRCSGYHSPVLDLLNESVSEGTMRNEDLFPVFLDTLRKIDHARHDKFVTDPANQWETNSVYNDEIMSELFDILNEYAPPGYYFGSHVGDGAAYGFWRDEQ